LSAFRSHQIPHLESVDDLGYERVVRTTIGMGWFRVLHDEKQHALLLTVCHGEARDAVLIANSVRRMFDLDADPVVIGQAMSNDPHLATLWKRHPGLRVFRSWSGFESMLTTILGQLVSVSFGRTLINELMKAAGERARHPKTGESIHLFPTAKRLLSADLATVRTSESRRTAIRSLATLVADGTLKWEQPMVPKELRKTLLSVTGIGAWTSEYVAMRGFHDDDAFPATDYGLKQELKRHPQMNVNRVRPWRAYAATALWKSFAATKGAPYESLV
jgi:DNA-3-methyladenine glycosylase II